MLHNYTVVLGVFNEQDRIEFALRNFLNRAEIVVIDNYSTDNTIKIAEKYTKKIYHFKNQGFWNAEFYDFALDKVETDFVYFASAAEIVPSGVLDAFDQVAEGNSAYLAVTCMRKSISSGVWTHRNWRNPERVTSDAKLARKDCFDFSRSRIHSERPINISRSQVLLLPPNDENVIWQFRDYDTSVTELKHNAYGIAEAIQRFESGERTSILKIIYLSIKEFASSYFLDGGFQAGSIGFFTAVWRSQMRFNIQVRIWEYQNDCTLADIKRAHSTMRESMLKIIEGRITKK